MGQSSLNGPFSIAMLNYQRVVSWGVSLQSAWEPRQRKTSCEYDIKMTRGQRTPFSTYSRHYAERHIAHESTIHWISDFTISYASDPFWMFMDFLYPDTGNLWYCCHAPSHPQYPLIISPSYVSRKWTSNTKPWFQMGYYVFMNWGELEGTKTLSVARIVHPLTNQDNKATQQCVPQGLSDIFWLCVSQRRGECLGPKLNWS